MDFLLINGLLFDLLDLLFGFLNLPRRRAFSFELYPCFYEGVWNHRIDRVPLGFRYRLLEVEGVFQDPSVSESQLLLLSLEAYPRGAGVDIERLDRHRDALVVLGDDL